MPGGERNTRVAHICTCRQSGQVYQTVEEHLQKSVTSHQTDWDARLPIFLLAHRASTHDTMGLTATNVVFGREISLSSYSGHRQQEATHHRSY
jgi:hypothetical protein